MGSNTVLKIKGAGGAEEDSESAFAGRESAVTGQQVPGDHGC